MAPRSEARLVEDLRDFLDDFAFRAKRLAAPLLRPFGPSAEPAAVDDAELDRLKAKLRRIRATLRAAEDGCAAGGKRKREIILMYSSSPDRLSRKIARIMERYNEIARDRDALRLRSGDGERRQDVSPMTPSSCLMKCRLHGREWDLRRVTEMLLSDEESCCDVFSVVPIVGPAGVGKTTRCKGLPLAANAAGHVLSTAIDRNHWEAIEQSDLWSSEVVEQTIPALLDELEAKGNTLHINFPSSIFKLLGSLRALDLSNTNMEHLPHSVGELIHLSLIELPKGIKFLTNLRHLELPSMDDWNIGMPCGIGELTNLETMHVIKVGVDSESCGIADLVNLNKLRGELCISGIENVTSAQITPDARNGELCIKNKGKLRKLILHWSSIDSMFSDEASSVLDSLQPHPDLEELTIRGFSGIRFPFQCQVLPFQNLFVQDSQKTWTFLRCAGRKLECNCNTIAFTNLTFGQTNAHPSGGSSLHLY
ncbi:hypothetical protein HU200_031631 [Digitaria exilis]|uniref:R13L1/DRL21-like LRR repeat region domain-containing protein n=1 Tax=Digitaria exilis TaxID=1010633 RepID=A0A835BPM1_9POAL|nr:hypothetical protein HU200_031631 [Digitaria exilis]